MKRKCETCEWWDNTIQVTIGECRVKYPSIGAQRGAVWPKTHETHWCGEYRAKVVDEDDFEWTEKEWSDSRKCYIAVCHGKIVATSEDSVHWVEIEQGYE